MKEFKKNLLAVLAIIAIVSFFFVISDFIIKTTMVGFFAAAVFAVSVVLWFFLGLSVLEEEDPDTNTFSDDLDDGGVTYH